VSDAPQFVGRQEPRLRVAPDYVSSAGEEAIELCALAGLHLDPWEQLVLMDMLGERADGKWASFQFGIVAPRQNGKDAILEGRELVGLFLLGEELIVHSAHEQATASEHFRRLLMLIESVPEFDRRVLKAPRGKGAEAIELRGGQRIFFKTRTAGGGRGLTGDLVVLNEAMILPASVMGALVPTMAARSLHGNPQLVYAGSAVDQQVHEHGVSLARLRARAIQGVPRIGLCEWSADVAAWRRAHGLRFDEDVAEIDQVTPALLADEEVWAQANPGLGIRISVEHIANEHGGALGVREFAVERLGIGDWPDPDGEDGAVITLDQWDGLCDARSKPLDPVCLAFDVAPSRSLSSIGVCGLNGDGLDHVGVIEEGEGTGWVVARLAELVAEHKPFAVICDSGSAAASLIPDLEKLKIEVTTTSTAEFAAACGMLFDAVDQGKLRHRGHDDLRSAVKGAQKRPLGDGAWLWSRKASGPNITSLVACTLALWGQRTMKPKKKVPPVMFA
jgi:hypothetical protein